MQEPLAHSSTPLGTAGAISNIHWGAALAGALAAAAVWLVLEGFGLGIGLSIASPAPSWRNASVGLALLSGIWILLMSIASFAVGGYIAGRVRARMAPAGVDEVEFRDGIQGLLAWAIAVLIGALMLLAMARTLAPAFAEREGGAPSASAAGGGEPRFVSYEVDRLFRADRRTEGADLARGEAGRLLMASVETRNFTPDDRSYLVRLVTARTGLAGPDAERRVDAVVAQTREKANRARRSAVVVAFMTAASLLIGAVIAWAAACAGGRHRDGDTVPSLNWRMPTLTLK